MSLDSFSPRLSGRLVAALIVAQAGLGAWVTMGVLPPVMRPPGFLVNAAAHPGRIPLAAVLLLGAALATLAIAITLFPLVRQHGERMAYWLVALAAAGLATQAVEVVTLLTMNSVSQHAAQSAQAGGADAYAALGATVRVSRYWAHYVNLMVNGAELLVLYGALLRSALVPRALAGFGLLASALQLTAVTMPLFGERMVMAMLTPLAASQLLLATWMLARGPVRRP